MAQVTVNVVGNGVSGSSSQPTESYGAPRSGGGGLPDNARMVEDVRREMQARGVIMVPGSNNAQQIINQYGQNIKSQSDAEIKTRYDNIRETNKNAYEKQYDAVDAKLDKEREERLKHLGSQADDPFYAGIVDNEIGTKRDREYSKIRKGLQADEESINKEEAAEKDKVNKELTESIKALTAYFKDEEHKKSSGSDGYVSQLRAQQRELIQKREGAGTEEEAKEYNKQLIVINERLRKVTSTNQDEKGGRSTSDTILNTSRGVEQFFSSAQNGNLGGMLMGGGSTAVALSGATGAAAAKAMGVIAIADGVVRMFQNALGGEDAFGSISAMIGGSRSKSNLLQVAGGNIAGYGKISDLGLNQSEFAQEVGNRMRQRGLADGMYPEAYRQIGLESYWGLQKGTLGGAGKYDIYGTNSTNAVNDLLTALKSLGVKGVSGDDFSRAQEKLDFQQSLMGSYLSRADKPDYGVANSTVLGMNAVTGITHDSRDQSDYATFSNAIQQPKNDAMKALIYSVVSDILPETAGRADLMERAIHDPKNEGKIMQSVMQRLNSQFGGTNTQMGYFVAKSLFPNIADDRLDQYTNQLSSGKAGELLRNGSVPSAGDGAVQKNVNDAKTSYMNNELSDSLTGIGNNITTLLSRILNAVSDGVVDK